MTTSQAQTRCRLLRCKSSYGHFGDYQEELEQIMGATTTYWCLRTMGKAGPDEHFVHRSVCIENRACWQRPDEE